jgi:hypothetical protein
MRFYTRLCGRDVLIRTWIWALISNKFRPRYRREILFLNRLSIQTKKRLVEIANEPTDEKPGLVRGYRSGILIAAGKIGDSFPAAA